MLYSAPTRRCSKAWLHWTQAPVTHVRRSRETTCPERTWTVAGARRKDNQRIQERGEHWPMRPQITRGSCRRVLSFLFFYMDARDGYFKKEMSSSAISCKSKYYILPPLKKGRKTYVIHSLCEKNNENQNTSPPENCVISLEILVLKLFVETQKKI